MKDREPPIVLGWYTKEQWPAYRQLMEDEVDELFETWLEKALEVERQIKDEGRTVIRLPVDLSDFDLWCTVRNAKRDRSARARYVLWKISQDGEREKDTGGSRVCMSPPSHTAKVMTIGRNKNSRVGIFGGTFDPVHLGHLLAAQDMLERGGLDHVVFVPAAQNPLKAKGPVASGKDRVGMLRAAVAGYSRFSVSTVDLERPVPSYALDTVRALRRERGDGDFVWVLGADQVADLPRWHRAEDLAAEIEFLVLRRPGGEETTAPALSGLRLRMVETRLIDVSSTEIRERFAMGKPVDFFLPCAVIDYIDKSHIYTTPHP